MATAECSRTNWGVVSEHAESPRIPWHLVVVSHKLCWPSADSATGFATDGGFPMQMRAISELFASTTLVVPVASSGPTPPGLQPLTGRGMTIRPLGLPRGTGWRRKANLPIWLIRNGRILFDEIQKAQAVHTPIPGDVGTFGMLMAHAMHKPLFVRHCGNWFVQTTRAERFWRWYMEQFAGGSKVMLATGGAMESPSARNPKVDWIFSTSLTSSAISSCGQVRQHRRTDALRLLIACRQDEEKGTGVVLRAFPEILEHLPGATLEILGDGPELAKFRTIADQLSLSERVRFHGRVNHDEVMDAMSRSDVFVYPTAASEGFPKVVLEALASGLPVVSTKVSVIPLLLSAGGGVVLESRQPSELARRVLELWRDPEKYEQMSRAAIESVSAYSLERWRDLIGDRLVSAWAPPPLDSECAIR